MYAKPATTHCCVCSTEVGAADVVWRKDGFDIVRCAGCGLVFRSDLPDDSEIAQIYGGEYFTRDEQDSSGQGYLDYVADAENHRLNARRRLAALRAAPDGAELLDVGAAAGFFVEQAVAAGWKARGVDVSDEMAAYGRDELSVDVTTGLFQKLEVDSQVDAVTMWDYIEHSHDPVGDIERAFAVLKPGGLLAISTGDIDSLVGRLSGRRWHLLTPRHHNFFFSRNTLPEALRRAGFEVVELRHRAYWFSVGYLAHKTRTMLTRSRVLDRFVASIVDSRAGGLSVPVNLFDVMTVIARKPLSAGAAA
ncbi:MAG: class I SAM-dependent methyltransferase [Actinobacteria bacterium]|nr:class I SAM-dependent methyltransferase [Actinomycetota bacterium]